MVGKVWVNETILCFINKRKKKKKKKKKRKKKRKKKGGEMVDKLVNSRLWLTGRAYALQDVALVP